MSYKHNFNINGKTYTVKYNTELNIVEVIPPNELLEQVNPSDFKHIGAKQQINGTPIELECEKDGILMTDVLEKTFKLEFMNNDTVTTTVTEAVIYPPVTELDEDEEFFQIKDGEYLETYQYGADENVAYQYYWDAMNLRQWFCDLDLNKSKEFREDGYMGLRITCIGSESYYLHEKL